MCITIGRCALLVNSVSRRSAEPSIRGPPRLGCFLLPSSCSMRNGCRDSAGCGLTTCARSTCAQVVADWHMELQGTGDAAVAVCSCSLSAAASASAFLRRARTSSVKASLADPLSPAEPSARSHSLRDGCLAVKALCPCPHGLLCVTWRYMVHNANVNECFDAAILRHSLSAQQGISIRGQPKLRKEHVLRLLAILALVQVMRFIYCP